MANSTTILPTLDINVLSEEQYNTLVESGEVDENALYFTPGKGFSPVLLWTNATPTVNFAAQIINIDLSDYEWILISHKPSKDDDYLYVDIFKVGTTSRLTAIASGMSRRVLTINTDSINFNGGYNLAANGSSFASSNAVCVPYQIYGL